MDTSFKRLVLPFILTISIIFLDQLTKALIICYVDLHTIGFSIGGDFIRIIHARNPGIAFSMGGNLSEGIRVVLFTILPLLVLGGLMVYYFISDSFTFLQRRAVAGILGGGIGNVVDRLIRSDGVVDFIDVKFFGIFGLERWPTFNIADASVVVCGLLFIATMIIQEVREKNEQES